jgi:hypothetical protein
MGGSVGDVSLKVATITALFVCVLPYAARTQTSRPSAVACDNYARNYANQESRQGQVLRRGAAGSLLGLGIGSIAGAGGTGAAVGAAVGIIGGGLRRNSTADRMYDAAYHDCMNR